MLVRTVLLGLFLALTAFGNASARETNPYVIILAIPDLKDAKNPRPLDVMVTGERYTTALGQELPTIKELSPGVGKRLSDLVDKLMAESPDGGTFSFPSQAAIRFNALRKGYEFKLGDYPNVPKPSANLEALFNELRALGPTVPVVPAAAPTP